MSPSYKWIVWFYVIGIGYSAVWIGYKLNVRRKRGPLFPVLAQSDILYQVNTASGRSMKNAFTRIGGANNCLKLTVTRDELWTTIPLAAIFADSLDKAMNYAASIPPQPTLPSLVHSSSHEAASRESPAASGMKEVLMNMLSGRSLYVKLLAVGILATLLLVPSATQAQGPGTSDTDTATGVNALNIDTTGYNNTADGYQTLFLNTTGYNNTANGYETLYSNTLGYNNTSNGSSALFANTTGYSNSTNGVNTLFKNTTGSYNTANGANALYSNTIGYYNTANGSGALYYNISGYSNTANGDNSLYYNTTGQFNTANGVGALYYNTAGNNNTADGYFALFTSTGDNNIALGINAGNAITTGSNNIVIGNPGSGTDTGIIRIGTAGVQKQTYIAGISGVAANGGVAVYINANGQLGTLTSSQRFKYDIRDMGTKSDKLMDLRPVMFRYKEATEDGTHPVQYGLIAEDVAKVYPDLVQYDKQGKPFTVYYHLLTPMMLNELQKAHQKIDSLEARQQSQSSGMASMQHTVQLLLMMVTALVLVVAVLIAYVLSTRMRRSPSWQVRPIENAS